MTDLSNEILAALKRSEFWTDRTRDNGSSIKALKCPSCGYAEAWANLKDPRVLHCNRKNRCGERTRTLSLFPEILEAIEERNKPTDSDPHKPARVYLRSRGIIHAQEGLIFQYWPNVRNLGRGAVMFPVGPAWNGRLFNPPPGGGKTHNQGSTKGKFWKHPGIEHDPLQDTFVTEGILDALSFREMGFQSIAVLSSGADPGSFNFGELSERLIFAFDRDQAGAEALRRWKAAYPDAGAITTVRGDWNDLLIEHGDGATARKYFDGHLPEFRVRAQLQLARSGREYAQTWFGFYGAPPGIFEHGRETWFSWAKAGKDGPDVFARRVGNFTCTVDHYQRDAMNLDEPTFRYHLTIRPKSGVESKCTFTGAELAQPGSLRGAFLTRTKVLWEGDVDATLALVRRITESRAPVVRQVRIVGFDGTSGAHIFRGFAISKAGKLASIDARGFIQVGGGELLRPPTLDSLQPEPGISASKIYDLIARAWPNNGPLAVAFTVGSWFAPIIRPTIGFFPFLSLHGDVQTGKSNLARTLNRLQCIDEEGLPMTKQNTAKGELRKLAQRAGLSVALLEGNDGERIRFDLNSLLPLFNHGNPLHIRALKTNGLETHSIPFGATLLFVQNSEPFSSRAQRERVVSSRKLQSGDLSEASKSAFHELMSIPARKLAHFFVEAMTRRGAIESTWRQEYEKARDEVFTAIADNRLSETHGLILGIHRAFCRAMNIQDDLTAFMIDLARIKAVQCSDRAASLADAFFQGLDLLSKDARESCCETDRKGQLFIKLAKALQQLNEARAASLPVSLLHEDLRRHPAYIEANRPYRGYFGEAASTSCRVWAFDIEKLSQC